MSEAPARAGVVVVGAGMGGLACAARLARAGVDVALVEQDRRVGGTAGSFVRGGCTIPAGPLGVTVPAFVDEALAACGARDLPRWERSHFRLRTDLVDVLLSQPLAALAEDLARHFPAERDGIRAVAAALADGVRASRSEAGGFAPRMGAEEFCRRHLRHEALVRLFSSQGSERTRASLAVMVRMWDFLAETGVWYPSCGIHGLGVLLRKAFAAAGGRLLLGRAVERILVEGGRAAGVRLSDGETIRARAVVSNAEPAATVRSLLDPRAPGIARLRRSFAARRLSGSVLSVAVGVEPRAVAAGFDEHHLLFTRRTGDARPWLDGDPAREGALDAEQVWIGRVSRHDPALAPAGRELWVLRVDAPWDRFSALRRSPPPHEPAYYALKAAAGDAVVRAAAAAVPGLEGSAEVLDVATPLTYERWGHRTRGAVAGWAWTGSGLRDFTALPVPGVFCVGICAYSPLLRGGMGTALLSGLSVAARVIAGGAR